MKLPTNQEEESANRKRGANSNTSEILACFFLLVISESVGGVANEPLV